MMVCYYYAVTKESFLETMSMVVDRLGHIRKTIDSARDKNQMLT
jgi:hypothetical protein